MVGSSVGVITALTPHIGYAAAAALAKTALLTGRNVADLVVEAKLMSREEVTRLLSPGPPQRPRGDHDRHPGRSRPRPSRRPAQESRVTASFLSREAWPRLAEVRIR